MFIIFQWFSTRFMTLYLVNFTVQKYFILFQIVRDDQIE